MACDQCQLIILLPSLKTKIVSIPKRLQIPTIQPNYSLFIYFSILNRKYLLILCYFFILTLPLINNAQTISKSISKQSLFYELNADSLTVYECRVSEATQELTTADGQKIKTGSQKLTITNKYHIKCINNSYQIHIYTAGITPFPNRKFSGLKIREKKYWEFRLDTSFVLSNKQLALFLIAEDKGKEANEYDYAITKHTRYQLIFKRRKNFKQLVFDQSLNLKQRILNVNLK